MKITLQGSVVNAWVVGVLAYCSPNWHINFHYIAAAVFVDYKLPDSDCDSRIQQFRWNKSGWIFLELRTNVPDSISLNCFHRLEANVASFATGANGKKDLKMAEKKWENCHFVDHLNDVVQLPEQANVDYNS